MSTLKKHYEITLSETNAQPEETVKIVFQDQHDILKMIEKTKDATWFEDKSQNAQFVLGLRLFANVMLKEGRNPLFAELLPAFKQFMKTLKKHK